IKFYIDDGYSGTSFERPGFQELINDIEKSKFSTIITKDISKKIKSAYHTKALEGKFTAPFAPYGYMKDPNNKHKLIINPETSPVVKRIFELARQGLTTFKISMILNKDKILKPRAQIIKDHGKYIMDKFVKYPY